MVKYLTGEVIVECLPDARVLNFKEKENRCDFCFKQSSSLKKCSKCKQMFYCNLTCQRKDWASGHKHGECRFYCLARDKLQRDCDRLLLRLHLITQFDDHFKAKQYQLMNAQRRSIVDLMDHVEEIREEGGQRLATFYAISRRFDEIGVKHETENLFKLFGQICTNCFSILDVQSLNGIASGIYVEASLFDHSCEPNAAAVFSGPFLRVRALRDIDTDVQSVVINYIDLKASTNARRAALEEQYYFTCHCSRCADDRIVDEEYNSVKSLDQTFDDFIEEQNWREAYLAGIKSLLIYEKIYGEFHPDLTLQLMRVLKVRLLLDDEKEFPGDTDSRDGLKFIISRLNASLNVTHGRDHELYTVFLDLIN